jgi:hypothetical protein
LPYLFDSQGQHIANFVNGQLHAPTGQNIGHFLEAQSIFIDMHGGYLGEIVHENRLLRRRNSSHQSVNYGNYGNYRPYHERLLNSRSARMWTGDRLRSLAALMPAFDSVLGHLPP